MESWVLSPLARASLALSWWFHCSPVLREYCLQVRLFPCCNSGLSPQAASSTSWVPTQGRSTWLSALSSQRGKSLEMSMPLSMSNQIKQYIYLYISNQIKYIFLYIFIYFYISNQINHNYRGSSSLRQTWVSPNSPELYLEHGQQPSICTNLLGFLS